LILRGPEAVLQARTDTARVNETKLFEPHVSAKHILVGSALERALKLPSPVELAARCVAACRRRPWPRHEFQLRKPPQRHTVKFAA
jgi:hypothetical protein